MGMLLRMCILPVLWKVNGLWWSDVKGNTFLSCSCVRFSVFVSNAICSHPLRQFEDLLVVPSRLFFCPVQRVIWNDCSHFVQQSDNRR